MTFSKIDALRAAVFRHLLGAVLIFIFMVTAFAVAAWYYPPTYRAWSVMEWHPNNQDLLTKSDLRSSHLANKASRIFTDKKLTEITRSRGLGLNGKNQSQLLAEIRKNIAISILPDVSDRGILFTVSYNSYNPETAVLVAKDLTSLFLTDPPKSASETTPLKTLVNDLETSQAALEKIIELFKIQNAGYLPEHVILNKQMIENLSQQKAALERRLASLKDNWAQTAENLSTGHPENSFFPMAVKAASFHSRPLGLLGLIAFTPSENYDDEAREKWRHWRQSGQLIIDDLASKRQVEQKLAEYKNFMDRSKIVYEIYLQFTANLKMNERDLAWARKELEQAASPMVTGNRETVILTEGAESHLETAGPEVLWWLIIGISLGLALSAGYILVRELTSQRVNSPKTASSLTGWPVIGVLPAIKNKTLTK